ncbi:MAG: type II secretion system major pseudopilin GspG [Spongiibacteraceae bacterium]|nr:type II secretion system major pseudopilin GspG [Spongiibacteraceae bacterium]
MVKTAQQGFTLIEIMVVMVIISVLIGLVAPNILGRVDEARVTAARADLATLQQALEMYKLDNHRYPSTDQGLQALVQKPTGSPEPKKWNLAGYLKKGKIPLDPWGEQYQYLSPGSTGAFDVYSFGADAREGGEGFDADVGSWDL